MKNRKWIGWAVVLALLVVFSLLFHFYVKFDWGVFWSELRHADPKRIAFAVLCIYCTYAVRSIRWAIFVRPTKHVGPLDTLGAQFIGFTSTALFGRLADLARPYLIARRLKLPVSSQLAVYTIERMFDLGSAAIIFSSALLFSTQIAAMPHHEAFVRVGQVSMIITLCIAAFAIGIRVAGEMIANGVEAVMGKLSAPLAKSVANKFREFRDGLNVLASVKEFFIVLTLSLGMWGLIAIAYIQTAHAFVETPQLANLSFGSTMLLMATSIGGSMVQMPVVGWFTQIAITATAMHGFYGAPIEAATACGGVLLFVTFLSIVPVGLIWAQVGNISVASTTNISETAASEIE